MFRRIALQICLLAACLFASSCIDGKEEIWLDANGSGRAEFTYDVPSKAAALHGGATGVDELISSFLEGQPGATHTVTSEDGRLKVFVRLPFDSPQDLKNLASPEKAGTLPPSFKYFAGTIDIQRSGRTFEISRTVDPGKALPGARFIPKSQLVGRQLSYIIHLPIPAEESNATRTEDSNRTLIWEVPLAKGLSAPIATRFKAVIPIPGWLIPTGIGTILILIIAASALLRSRKHK